MVPTGIVSSFFYVLDIIKDLIQLSLFLQAVHGFKYALKYWNSFSSVVGTLKFSVVYFKKIYERQLYWCFR